MAAQPPARFAPPQSGSVEQRLRAVTDQINKKADQTLQPVYSAVQLIASDGGVWRLTVSTTGALQVTAVPR